MSNITKEQLKTIIKEEIVEKRQAQIMINEGLGDILRDIGGASIQKIKAWFVDKMAEAFGIDKSSSLYEFVRNMAEDFTFEDFMDLIRGTEGRCNTVAQEFVAALQETIIENIPEMLGIEDEEDEANRGMFMKIIREIVVEAFKSESATDFVAEKMCAALGVVGDAVGTDPLDDMDLSDLGLTEMIQEKINKAKRSED